MTDRILRSARAANAAIARRGVIETTQKTKKFTAYAPGNLTVQHDAEGQHFYIKLGDDCATLQYEKRNNTLDLIHTEVPPIFRGQGVGGLLAKAALEYIEKNNFKVKLTCEYVQKYFEEKVNPSLKHRLTKE